MKSVNVIAVKKVAVPVVKKKAAFVVQNVNVLDAVKAKNVNAVNKNQKNIIKTLERIKLRV